MTQSTSTLTEVSEPPTRRDTSKASKASAVKRSRLAAERLAEEKFAPSVDLLSSKTVAKMAELLIARCVGKLDDATLVDLTQQLVEECERRGIPDLLGEDEA